MQFCAGRRVEAAGCEGRTKGPLGPGRRGAQRGRLLLGPRHRLETPSSGVFTYPLGLPGSGPFGLAHVIVAAFGDHR